MDVDSLGRVLVPDYLKAYANLKEKVVITGVYKRLEIWDEDKWVTYKTQIDSHRIFGLYQTRRSHSVFGKTDSKRRQIFICCRHIDESFDNQNGLAVNSQNDTAG